ncbi:E3 ubiquitin-protein ligase [Lachnellula suecica]|uniref:E3 ubiquitin-protein ligase n=1 Tax=Lachnellula suecica TaxID=602035 RepID=A0A8T9CC58_9HELO|nr:E3 ubiquitin-protein ligase [Lachnellula suecica]
MPIINQVLVEVLHVAERHLERRNLGGTTGTPDPTPQMSSTTSASTAATTSPTSGGGGPTSSPLLFFVALGFGVVFTNLWIIVGVKYCFRYNARNRAIRNGEEVDPINLENMPTRPHRRRREKKLMTMDEVNERFPLTKYKAWVASRASEGLPTSGGVAATGGTAPSSRAGSVRDVEGVMPASPVGTKHSVNTRPATANSEREIDVSTTSPEIHTDDNKQSMEANAVEKEEITEQRNSLEQVRTTASTVGKHPTVTSEMDEDDDDDHIHTAVPPELLQNPGDSCAICIDTLEEDDDIRGLTCGHAFHAGCLDPWLTSRRACCPLCKADYYTPKPRPEGEVAAEATDRTGRRRETRMNLPQQPQSTWTGIRGNPRLILPGRFGAAQIYNGGDGAYDQNRRSRRTRRPSAPPGDAAGSGGSPEATTAAPRRWRPRNPFSGVSMPTMRFPGRNHQAEQTAPITATTDPSPSQLEAGVVR